MKMSLRVSAQLDKTVHVAYLLRPAMVGIFRLVPGVCLLEGDVDFLSLAPWPRVYMFAFLFCFVFSDIRTP